MSTWCNKNIFFGIIYQTRLNSKHGLYLKLILYQKIFRLHRNITSSFSSYGFIIWIAFVFGYLLIAFKSIFYSANFFACTLCTTLHQSGFVWGFPGKNIVEYWLIVLESSITVFLFWETGGSYYVSHQKWSESDKKKEKKEIVQSFPTVLILNSMFELHYGIRDSRR